MKGRPTLVTLLDSLPANGEWSHVARDRWLRAMTAMVDLFVEVVEAEPAAAEEGRDGG